MSYMYNCSGFVKYLMQFCRYTTLREKNGAALNSPFNLSCILFCTSVKPHSTPYVIQAYRKHFLFPAGILLNSNTQLNLVIFFSICGLFIYVANLHRKCNCTKPLVFCWEDLCFVLEAVHIKLKVLILLWGFWSPMATLEKTFISSAYVNWIGWSQCDLKLTSLQELRWDKGFIKWNGRGNWSSNISV